VPVQQVAFCAPAAPPPAAAIPGEYTPWQPAAPPVLNRPASPPTPQVAPIEERPAAPQVPGDINPRLEVAPQPETYNTQLVSLPAACKQEEQSLAPPPRAPISPQGSSAVDAGWSGNEESYEFLTATLRIKPADPGRAQ
jgi:hypothetical protein